MKSLLDVITSTAAVNDADLEQIKKISLTLVNSTKFVNDVAKLYKLPNELRAKSIECTNTIEERNMYIINACMAYFVSSIIKCDDPRVVLKFCDDKFEELFPIFMHATLNLLMENSNEKERV
jgi:hypothetical protein